MKDYWVRREAEERKRGEKGEPAMGGNGREPRFCVCAQLLPRKTRPQRRWDLISAWRHCRKLAPLEWRGCCATLNVLPEKRAEPEQRSSSPPSQRRPMHGRCSPGRLSLVRHVSGAAPASNTFTAIRADRKSVTLVFASRGGQVSSESDIRIWIWSAAGIRVGTCAKN